MLYNMIVMRTTETTKRKGEMMETQANQMRTGENWEAFLRKYKLRNIRDAGFGRYEVDSASGQTYTTKISTAVDEDGCYYDRWSCNCPARGECRHIDAVVNMRWAEAAAMEDYDGMDVMEREQ